MDYESVEETSVDDWGLPPDLVNEYGKSNTLSLTESVYLGTRLEYLRRTGADQIEIEQKTVLEVLYGIHSLLENRKVDTVVHSLIPQFVSRLEDSEGSNMNKSQLEDLETKSNSWIHLLARELEEERRIPATDTGILDISKLSESPEELFKKSVWNWLDDRPQSDIMEACKTITVGCSTSSVMLSLRAVEHCLRKWYEQQDETLDAAWGRVLDQLMEEYAEDDKRNDTVLTQLSDLPPVLSTLYFLKEKRNEVNHPDKSPSAREARRTLVIVASTITEIHDEMRSEAAREADRIRVREKQTPTPSTKLSDKEERLYEVLKSMDSESSNSAVDKEELIGSVSDWDIDEEEVRSMIRNILMSGHAYEPADGKLKAI